MTRIEYVPPPTAPPQPSNSAYIPAYRAESGEQARYTPTPQPNMAQPPHMPYQQQRQQPPGYNNGHQSRDGQPDMTTGNGSLTLHRGGGNIAIPPPAASMNPGTEAMGASQRGRKYRDETGRTPIPPSMSQTQIAQPQDMTVHHHHPPNPGYAPPAPPRSNSAMIVSGHPSSQMDHGPQQHPQQSHPHPQQQQQPRGREGWYEDGAPPQPDMRGFPQDQPQQQQQQQQQQPQQGHQSRSRGRQNQAQGGEEVSEYHYLTPQPAHGPQREGGMANSASNTRLHQAEGYQLEVRRQHVEDGNQQGGYGRELQAGARHQGYPDRQGYPDAGPQQQQQQQQQPPPPPQDFGAPARPCTRKGHENYLCDVYCDVDQQHVCLLCLRRDDNHKQHKCNAVRVPPPEFRQSVTDWIQHAKVQQADIQETTRTLERTATQLQQSTEDEIQTLSETVEDLKRRLDMSKKKLSDQARAATKEEVAKLRELQSDAQGYASKIDEAVAEVRKINANSTLAEVVHLKKFIALTAFEKQEQRVPLRIVKFRAHNTLNSENLLQMAPKTEEMVLAPSTNPLNSRITSEVKVQGVDYELFQKNLA